jgi:1-acyl-sn-glycerol-3-phosphate acyltransferase
MENIFLNIYYFFKLRRAAFWSVFAGITALLALGASQIKIEEDITRFFPDDERVEKLNYVFRNSKFAERLVFMVSVKDSVTDPQPDSLIAYAEKLISAIGTNLKPYVSSINSQVDDSKILGLVDAVQEYLPLFLDERDYVTLDSLIRPDAITETLNSNYRQLISPSGMITKKIIANDPLGFSYLVLKKLQGLQYDNSIEVYDNYLLSKDHRHVIFFVHPLYKANETAKNASFIEALDNIILTSSDQYPDLKASYFGATAVAAGNARQLQQDTMITLSLMLVLLAIFLVGYFRRKRVPFLILVPVVFGALFSLCCVFLIQGYISIIAIAAGSIILGIAVNYSLHFFSHLKHTNDVPAVIRDLVKPMTLGSSTTVLAFLCLQFVNAAVLRDVGFFAAFSLIGAALCSLIILPQLIGPSFLQRRITKASLIEKFSSVSFASKKPLLIVILILTPVFFYFAPQVSFNSDLSQMNFMKPELREAQQRLESINKVSLTAVYVVSQGENLEKALRRNETAVARLNKLQSDGTVQKYSSVSSFIISDSLQHIRLNQWNAFWSREKINNLVKTVRTEGSRLNFSERIFQNFESMLTRDYTPADSSLNNIFRQSFFDDYIIEKDGLSTVITLANVAPDQKQKLYTSMANSASHAFDRQMVANLLAEYVHEDFNFIVVFTSFLVFFALFLSYGRIELTLITFIPMLVTWIWILGIMALVGIEFNIVNVMISTFIFGLGDDYSIFTMDGLQQEYKIARQNLPSIRTSILLSALTTISGLGVLIFAKHPALRSIAGISIIGIVCVFVMSQTIEPFLFRWLITDRTLKGRAPMTAWGIVRTFLLYFIFITGSFLLTLIGLILKLIPFAQRKTRLLFHVLICAYTRMLVYLDPSIKIRITDRTSSFFSTPCVLISNHSSFLDILFTLMLHPKLILLTNKWVWNSPVFGGVVRLANFYPVMEGAEDSVEKLRNLVAEGYSIVVFPEGKRSHDGGVQRFHKGAFYIAELLKLPVQPLLIHGAADAIPKNNFYINKSYVTLKFLPSIAFENQKFGTTYQERTKSISRYFKDSYHALLVAKLTPGYRAERLITNYIYKGPVLEWYMRIKLKLERNYEPFQKLIPARANILDMGCGYGFLAYMLYFLSGERCITGVDHDEEKIAVANNCYAKTANINFVQGDITTFAVSGFDVIIIADVLHYLLPEAQETVLKNCFRALNAGGKLIIREGNADLKERHKGTQLTEFFSVKVMKFNKSANTLHFLSGERLTQLARQHGFIVEVVDDTRFTSNIIFVISKPG